MQTDFLIIGQGLAGSLLAWELISRGCQVVVVDSGTENASLIAAGIINPITGMRFVKTVDVETLLPAAHDCYDQLSRFFGQRFYVKKPILRIFRDETELTHCKNRQQQLGYAPYLGNIAQAGQQLANLSTPYGFIRQYETGHLLTASLLSHLQQFFKERNSYRQDSVDYPSIQVDSVVSWKGIAAKQLIFCEGYHASHNPWFSWLPLRPAKGEILTLSNPMKIPNAILNYGNWLLPLGSGTMRIGATFDREQIDTQPSVQGRQTLLGALKAYSPSLAQSVVLAHQAGIRPCTRDRHPFIGRHPQYKKLAIFNGFGAKGSLQIPWYSQRFAEYLLNHQPLPQSCDIQRF